MRLPVMTPERQKAFEFDSRGSRGEVPKTPLGIFLLSPVLPGAWKTVPFQRFLYEPNLAARPLQRGRRGSPLSGVTRRARDPEAG